MFSATLDSSFQWIHQHDKHVSELEFIHIFIPHPGRRSNFQSGRLDVIVFPHGSENQPNQRGRTDRRTFWKKGSLFASVTVGVLRCNRWWWFSFSLLLHLDWSLPLANGCLKCSPLDSIDVDPRNSSVYVHVRECKFTLLVLETEFLPPLVLLLHPQWHQGWIKVEDFKVKTLLAPPSWHRCFDCFIIRIAAKLDG